MEMASVGHMPSNRRNVGVLIQKAIGKHMKERFVFHAFAPPCLASLFFAFTGFTAPKVRGMVHLSMSGVEHVHKQDGKGAAFRIAIVVRADHEQDHSAANAHHDLAPICLPDW